MKNYNTQTLENPSWIKRFSHKARFRQALALVSPSAGEKVLDYGAGDGSLTQMLVSAYPEASFSLFEPTPELYEQARLRLEKQSQNIVFYSDIHTAASQEFDVIVCQEVLEHLPKPIRDIALEQFSRLLKQDGKLVISVPIEIGLSALFKNLVRILVGQAHESTSLINILRAGFGKNENIPRIERNGYIDSHLGFDYHDLELDLRANGWNIIRRVFTPLPLSRGIFNSQVFYCLQRS